MDHFISAGRPSQARSAVVMVVRRGSGGCEMLCVVGGEWGS